MNENYRICFREWERGNLFFSYNDGGVYILKNTVMLYVDISSYGFS